MATLRKRSNEHWQARGRPPSGYTKLDLTDPEQLALAILRTLPKQYLYGLAANPPDNALAS